VHVSRCEGTVEEAAAAVEAARGEERGEVRGGGGGGRTPQARGLTRADVRVLAGLPPG